MERIVFNMKTDECAHTIKVHDDWCFDQDSKIKREEEDLGLTPDTHYACLLVPIPDTHRLASPSDREHPKPEGALYLTACGEWEETSKNIVWVPEFVYIVPKNCELLPALPRCRDCGRLTALSGTDGAWRLSCSFTHLHTFGPIRGRKCRAIKDYPAKRQNLFN